MLKKNLSSVLWLSLLNLPLALYSASAYAPTVATSPWFVLGTFTCAAVGHFFLYFFLVALVFIFPVLLLRKKGKGIGVGRYVYAALVVALAQIVLATDAQVFSLYRFHLSYAMLDLFINGGGEVISLSADTWWSIALQAAGIVLYAFIVLGVALFLAGRVRVGLLVGLALVMYVLANLVNAYAAARQVLPLMEIQNRLPLYRPLTMNSLLIKLGVVSPEELANRRVSVQQGLFDYPKAKLEYAVLPSAAGSSALGAGGDAASAAAVAATAPYNVLILTVDALRADMLNPEVMPYTSEFARGAWQYLNHYSASNSTRGGIFGLFYGLPPSYWQMALNSGVPSIITQVVQAKGYHYGIFTSANLYRPEFNATVFAGVPNLRVESKIKGGDVIARDQDAIDDFSAFLDNLPSGDRFLSFIFLDNVHAYSYPEGMEPVFKPSPASINHMELKADSDPTPILNRYKNAAYYADQNVHKVLTLLESHGLLDSTIVIITADHGEEINDQGDNFWGHNSNFKDFQLKIPFVMKWPNTSPRVITEVTSAYDVTATLLPRVFGVTNPRSDYTIGYDLFQPEVRDFVLTGSYLENAIVESDRIVLIDKFGMLRFKDKSYRDSTNTSRDHSIWDALKLMSYYLQNVPRLSTTSAPDGAVAASAAPASNEAAPATDAGTGEVAPAVAAPDAAVNAPATSEAPIEAPAESPFAAPAEVAPDAAAAP